MIMKQWQIGANKNKGPVLGKASGLLMGSVRLKIKRCPRLRFESGHSKLMLEKLTTYFW